MIHNIVTDKEGNEHQAVKPLKGEVCGRCSLIKTSCGSLGAGCSSTERPDEVSAIYKRKIKITDITRGK